jgi:hypothetical protein
MFSIPLQMHMTSSATNGKAYERGADVMGGAMNNFPPSRTGAMNRRINTLLQK